MARQNCLKQRIVPFYWPDALFEELDDGGIEVVVTADDFEATGLDEFSEDGASPSDQLHVVLDIALGDVFDE